MAEDNDGNRTLYNTRSVLLSNNLMAYLPFDGDITNKSSVALTTTAYGSPVSTTGLYGNAYSFNGASAIAISNNSSIKPISQLTLSLWVNANWFTNCRSGIDGMVSSTQSGGYSIGCRGELVEFNVFVGNDYKSVGFNKKSLSGWNKLTGTYDGSNLKIYLNGVVQSTLPLSGSISYNNNNSIQIGAEASDGTNPDYSLAFTGSIDEVMIYNRALTLDEIKADIPIIYTFSGIKSNISVNLLSGWTKCYSESYSSGTTTTASLKSNCSKNKVLLSCRLASDATNLILAAYADRASVFNSTTSTGNSTVVSNGVGWYYSDSLSIGFAPAGEAVSRNFCDTNDTTQGSLRICWHTSNNAISGGWRCGGNTGAGDLYFREAFHAD